MNRPFLWIYDRLSHHKFLTIIFLVAWIAVMVFMALHIKYEEDIAKFLPASEDKTELYQLSLQAEKQSRIAILFSEKDSTAQANTDSIEEAMETVAEMLGIQAAVDDSKMENILSQVYTHAPYLLTKSEKQRIDSLLSDTSYIARTLAQDKQQVILTNGMAMMTLKYDPLHLYDPVMQRFRKSTPSEHFQMTDGYLFSKDGKYAMITFDSPYGSSETHQNAALADSLQMVIDKASHQYPSLRISAIGAPLVAVTNAHQIKQDSLIASGIAVVLILALLIWHYRRFSDICWIGVSLAFGWLFALACMSIFYESISIIVLGVGSIIIGIAVNYPLHFMDHLREVSDKRETLSEMVPPLLIGNITTVAAFLCLVFLDAQAMRDLGAFGGFMLIGTILFVLIFLPVLASAPKQGSKVYPVPFIEWIGNRLSRPSWSKKIPVLPVVIILTLVLGYSSLNTSFDSNLQHINYMTAQQRQDMARMTGSVDNQLLQPFISQQPSYSYQLNWTKQLQQEFDRQCQLQGFSKNAFAPFTSAINDTHNVLHYTDFHEILSQIEMPNTRSAAYQLVDELNDSFNYVGFVCGFVVFLFLWLSFRKIELALMSFLPMAVSWIWILGMMDLLGVQFNIVNVILATFIFGQGDDYTIFITEGLLYEYQTGKKRLASYKRSVMLSAVLMFIGIGCLVFARHPALQSLGIVTVIGMATVVLMAYYLPPLVFRWLVRYRDIRPDSNDVNSYISSKMPLTLQRFAYSLYSLVIFLLIMYLFVLPYTWVYFHFGKITEEKRVRYHRLIQVMSRWIIHHVPGVKFQLENRVGETFDKPAILICNHQSHLDLMCLIMLAPKLIFLTKEWVWNNPFYGSVIHHAEYYPITEGLEKNMSNLADLYRRGYTVCIFPEGTRSADSSILRFHKGAFHLARKLKADILPVYLHGVGDVLPRGDFMLRRGSIHVEVGQRLTAEEYEAMLDAEVEASKAELKTLRFAKVMHKRYVAHYSELRERLRSEDYERPFKKLCNYY